MYSIQQPIKKFLKGNTVGPNPELSKYRKKNLKSLNFFLKENKIYAKINSKLSIKIFDHTGILKLYYLMKKQNSICDVAQPLTQTYHPTERNTDMPLFQIINVKLMCRSKQALMFKTDV